MKTEYGGTHAHTCECVFDRPRQRERERERERERCREACSLKFNVTAQEKGR